MNCDLQTASRRPLSLQFEQRVSGATRSRLYTNCPSAELTHRFLQTQHLHLLRHILAVAFDLTVRLRGPWLTHPDRVGLSFRPDLPTCNR